MKKEIAIFLTAIMFFTRIPCPKNIDHSPEILTKSSRYFSLVGIIVGGFSALVFLGFSYILPQQIALLFAMIATVWLTGAFHEDGFADVCDGFGGGWTKDKILTIMKDSRLGTYGVVGLGLLLALKFSALQQMTNIQVVISLITGHSISRFMAVILIYATPYVQDIDKSKIKPSAIGIQLKDVLIAGVFAIIPLFLYQNIGVVLVFIPLLLVLLKLAFYFKKWIGGHTGDCAGAAQQICEVVFYLSILVLWKFI